MNIPKLTDREKHIKHRQRVLCICGHSGAEHRPEHCANCPCKDFRRAAYQPAELPPWRRIPGPLAYSNSASSDARSKKEQGNVVSGKAKKAAV